MPAFNEAEGIKEFLRELHNDLILEFEPLFIVVNDASSDATAEAASSLAEQGLAIRVVTNDRNSGHGVSTRRALELGLEDGAPMVLAIDGDGQFKGDDVRRVAAELRARPNVEVIEGVRTSRTDPTYRKITSAATRTLVWSRCRLHPEDANTPLRVYRRDTLVRLLNALPNDVLTPNLFISTMVRKWRIPTAEIRVQSIPRRGSTAAGSTWGARSINLPTKRYLKFCSQATVQWFTTSVDRPSG